MVAFLDLFLHYNVAFKLVTVSGPLMLPAAAYSFAKGMRAPWPAPPAFAIAALGMLVQERTSWNIYGGNIASTLAGEYSFEIALAFSLFALGALAYTLDTGKRPWLPAVLIAAAIMSHIVVAIFVGVAAVLLWLVRRPWRTWPIAVSVGIGRLGPDRGVVVAAHRGPGDDAEHALRQGALGRQLVAASRTGSCSRTR